VFVLCICIFGLSIAEQKVERSSDIESSNSTLTMIDLHYYLMTSYAAYCTKPGGNLTKWGCYWCKGISGTVQGTYTGGLNMFGYVLLTQSEIIVSFRGSQSIENWIANLEFLKCDFQYPKCNCRVHSGFYHGYYALQAKLMPAVKDLVRKYNRPVTITGHSLGGALAVFCAADFVNNGIKVSKLVNFGEPRVGDQIFSTYFASLPIGLKYRVTNMKDIVPHVPTKLMGFKHIPTEVWYSTPKTNKICDNSGEDPTCSDSVIGDSVSDHVSYLGVPLSNGNPYGC